MALRCTTVRVSTSFHWSFHHLRDKQRRTQRVTTLSSHTLLVGLLIGKMMGALLHSPMAFSTSGLNSRPAPASPISAEGLTWARRMQ